MNKKNELICLVLFGETGHGKSTLGNAILGKEVFKANDNIQSVTKEVFGCKGIGKSKDIFVIDTPGINDSDGKDNEYLKKVATYLKKRKDIKGIVIVLNYKLTTSYQNSAEKSFQAIFKIFKSKNICMHIVIVFTHFFGSRKQPKRNEQGAIKEKIFDIFKSNFKNMFEQNCPINTLPFYFIDIEPDDDMDSESQMEIDNMITTIYSRNPINPKIIQVKNDYRVKDEIANISISEDLVKFEGNYIIKRVRTYKKTTLKYYDTSLNDSFFEELVDEKELKILNQDLVNQKKELELQKKKQKEIQDNMLKKIEEQRKKRKEEEEALQKLKEEQKKREEEMKKLEEQKRKIKEEKEKKRKEDEEKQKLKIKLEREEREKKRKEELNKKRERIRICKAIKFFIDNPGYESLDEWTVYELNQTYTYGYIKTPDWRKEIKIELLKTEKIDMPEKAFTTLTGNINGTLPGKVIFGFKLINRHSNVNGGSWKRNGKIFGTGNYNFTFTSKFWRGIHWTLELYGVTIPNDYYENKDLNEYDYY